MTGNVETETVPQMLTQIGNTISLGVLADNGVEHSVRSAVVWKSGVNVQ